MKRQNLTLLRYPGGKYYAVKLLIPFLKSVHYDEYREPFFGGGSIFWAKEKSKFNWINDLDSELINLLLCIQNSQTRNILLSMFEGEMEATKEKHEQVKNMVPKTKIERAYKYYYLNRTSFSGKMINPSWGYRPKRSVPPYRWHEKIIPCGEKLTDVKITNFDYEPLLFEPAKGEAVLLFIDPPYYNAKNHYIFDFDEKEHVRLAENLKKTKHKFVLTYDDCEEVRSLYSWAYIYELQFFYRLDNSRDSDNKRKRGSELVITNYPVGEFQDEK